MRPILTSAFRQLVRTASLPPPRPVLLPPLPSQTCPSCLHHFNTTPTLPAGHNKWSKTKHIKKRTDKIKHKDRLSASNSIYVAVKLYGPNSSNAANAIVDAKKASVPKVTIDQAIARGRGLTLTGEALEPVTVEIMMPGAIALVVDLETPNRSRIKQDFMAPVRKSGGTMTSCSYFFARRGKIVLAGKKGVDADSALEAAISHGAEDLEDDGEGNVVVWCPAGELSLATKGLSEELGLDVLDSGIVWYPNEETRVEVGSDEDADQLATFLSAITSEIPDLQGVYTNAIRGGISDQRWAAIEEHLNS